MKLALILLCSLAVGYATPYLGLALLVLYYAK